MRWYWVDAAVNTIVVPEDTVDVYPAKTLLATIFWFASRNTTELAPLDAVTPVPPYATPTVEPCQVPEATVPKGLTLPETSRFTDFPDG